MSRTKLLHLTLEASSDDSAWKVADAKERLEKAASRAIGDELRRSRGNATITVELYREYDV